MNTGRIEYTDPADSYDIESIVNLANKKLAKIGQIAAPLRVKVLNASSNALTSAKDIQLCPHLEYLHLSSNRFESIKGVDAFGHLQYLDLKKNFIKTLEGLDNMKNLRYLDISENKLLGLSGIISFPTLETLIASKNMIRAITELKSLQRLTFVDLRYNCIQNLDGLPMKLGPNVNTLYLDGNPIIEPVNLLFLRPFANLEKLSIGETPLVKRLLKRGINVLMAIEFLTNLNLRVINLEHVQINRDLIVELRENAPLSPDELDDCAFLGLSELKKPNILETLEDYMVENMGDSPEESEPLSTRLAIGTAHGHQSPPPLFAQSLMNLQIAQANAKRVAAAAAVHQGRPLYGNALQDHQGSSLADPFENSAYRAKSYVNAHPGRQSALPLYNSYSSEVQGRASLPSNFIPSGGGFQTGIGIGGAPVNPKLAQLNQSYQQYVNYLQYQQMVKNSYQQKQAQQAQTTDDEAGEYYDEDEPGEYDDQNEEGYEEPDVIITLTPSEYYRRLLSPHISSFAYKGRPDYLVDKVIKVQAFWRGWIVRKKLALGLVLNRAATFIQAMYRGYRTRKRFGPVLRQLHKQLRYEQIKIDTEKKNSIAQALISDQLIGANDAASKHSKLHLPISEDNDVLKSPEKMSVAKTEPQIALEAQQSSGTPSQQTNQPSVPPQSPAGATHPLESKVNQLEEMNNKMREKLDMQSEMMLNLLANQNLTALNSNNKLLSELKEEISSLKATQAVQAVPPQIQQNVVPTNNVPATATITPPAQDESKEVEEPQEAPVQTLIVPQGPGSLRVVDPGSTNALGKPFSFGSLPRIAEKNNLEQAIAVNNLKVGKPRDIGLLHLNADSNDAASNRLELSELHDGDAHEGESPNFRKNREFLKGQSSILSSEINSPDSKNGGFQSGHNSGQASPTGKNKQSKFENIVLEKLPASPQGKPEFEERIDEEAAEDVENVDAAEEQNSVPSQVHSEKEIRKPLKRNPDDPELADKDRQHQSFHFEYQDIDDGEPDEYEDYQPEEDDFDPTKIEEQPEDPDEHVESTPKRTAKVETKKRPTFKAALTPSARGGARTNTSFTSLRAAPKLTPPKVATAKPKLTTTSSQKSITTKKAPTPTSIRSPAPTTTTNTRRVSGGYPSKPAIPSFRPQKSTTSTSTVQRALSPKVASPKASPPKVTSPPPKKPAIPTTSTKVSTVKAAPAPKVNLSTTGSLRSFISGSKHDSGAGRLNWSKL